MDLMPLQCKSKALTQLVSEWGMCPVENLSACSLCHFLLGAVRKSQTAGPDCEIDSYAIHWFSMASDRRGGWKAQAKAEGGPRTQLAEV